LLLVGLPFLNWRLGALLWLCAWVIFLGQQLFKGKPLRDDPDPEE
jgi:hypothetical protein